MSIAEGIPGMRPGATIRNIVVLLVAIVFLPLLVLAFPVIIGVAVGRNYGGTAERLAVLPGIESKGGVKAGVIAFGYMIVVIAIIGTIGGTGSTSNGGEASPTVTETPTATSTATATDTPSEKELARTAAQDGLTNSGSWSSGLREISFVEKTDGTLLMRVRYNLDTRSLDGADDAEKRAGFTARYVLVSLVDSRVTSVSEVAIFAYVPTSDGGDSVSTKVVIQMDTAQSINWDACAWECIPERADQYKFNRYLYE